MSWFFSETKEPYGEIRRKEVDWIEEIFVGERICRDNPSKSPYPREEPCNFIFSLGMMIELGKYCNRSHHFDHSIGRDE
jgi:hypothetical protein